MEAPHRFSLDAQEQCKSEEVEAKRWMDRASRYLIEGRYESAIQLLQKTESVFPNCKNLPELTAVTQVCYAATWRACYCARPYTRKLPDWYLVLKVDERADFDTIKKRYRQLALLLHPDKNKHVNSEGAFKTITEAYACLSDKEKRDIFNLERRRSFCVTCSRKAQQQRSAGHVSSSRPGVKTTPQTPSLATPAPESDSLQNLRERANATVNNLERDWGGKTSKWMQNLASVRQRYWNVAGESPLSAGTEPPPPSSKPQEYVRTTRSKVPSSPILPDGVPEATATKLDFNAFELRRATTTVRTATATAPATGTPRDDSKETIDVLLKRLRAERSAAAREFESPLAREFGVHARTPEAAHLLRPLSVGKTRRSSSVDYKCEGGSLYSSWMPKGRCLSRKAPLSPTKVVRRVASSVNVADRGVVPRAIFPSSEPPQKASSQRDNNNDSPSVVAVDPVRVSSSVRLESLYPTSPVHKKDDVLPSEPARTSLSVKRDEFLFSATAVARSSSVRVESARRPSSPKQEQGVRVASPGVENAALASARSSSVRLENALPDFTVQNWSRSIARTASGSWTNAVKTHPEFFDDVFTPVRKDDHALKPAGSPNEAAGNLKSSSSSRVSGVLSAEQSQRRLQRKNTRSSENLAPRVLNRAPAAAPAAVFVVAAENAKPEARPALGAMSENLSSYTGSSKSSLDYRKDAKVTLSSLEKGRASRLVQLQDMERKQKSDAMNGILERLRAEAKTVAATLDRARENVGAENMGRPERVY